MTGLTALACSGAHQDAGPVAPPLHRPPVSAPAPAAPTSATHASPNAPETPFHLVLVADDLNLFALGDDPFVNIGCNHGGPFATVRLAGGNLELTTALLQGRDRCFICACAFYGRWPGPLLMPFPRRGEGDGCTTHELNVKRGEVWVPLDGTDGGQFFVTGWSHDRTLLVAQDCALVTSVAALDENGRLTMARDLPSVSRELGYIRALASFETGEVLALSAPTDGQPLALAVWRSGIRQPNVHPLPEVSFDSQAPVSMVAHGPANVFVGASTEDAPYLAHFDGTRWSRLPVSGPRSAATLRPARDGGLWFLEDGPELWHRNAAGAFDSLRLPGGFTPTELVEIATGDVWLASDREVYRTGSGTLPMRVQSDCPKLLEAAPQNAQGLDRCHARLEPLER